MSSDAQITANRTNAQLSTGPTSDAGRAASSQNHLSHGFESEFRLLPGEDGPKFNTLLRDFLTDWTPANSIERTLVTNLAEFQWLSERARRLQNQALDQIDREGDVSDSATAPKHDPAQLERLLRYHTQFDRAFHRALTALMQFRAARQKEQIGFELAKQRSEAETAHQKHLDRRFALEEMREQRAMRKQELELKKEARAAEREARADQRAAEKATSESEVATAKIATETAKTQLFEADWEAHAIMNAPIPGVGYTQVQKDVYREVLKQTCKEAA